MWEGFCAWEVVADVLHAEVQERALEPEAGEEAGSGSGIRFIVGGLDVSPHQVTKDFEAALCRYAGSKYAVAVNSCTAALTIAVAWHLREYYQEATSCGGYRTFDPPLVEIPRRTYVSVPCSIIHAGGGPIFRDEAWRGFYQLKPYPIFDSARWFTKGLFESVTLSLGHRISPAFVCVSFHASKTLGLEQGGAILHDCDEADAWFRRMRFDGRTEGVAPKDDDFREVGFHCYMNPSTAAQGLLKLHSLPECNAPLPQDEYPDLSAMEIFR